MSDNQMADTKPSVPEGYDSFYSVFAYNVMEMNGSDGVIMFGNVEILRDIPALGLKVGHYHEHCFWNIRTAEFDFCDVFGSNISNQNLIRQVDLAPYLVWWDSDLPKDNQ